MILEREIHGYVYYTSRHKYARASLKSSLKSESPKQLSTGLQYDYSGNTVQGIDTVWNK